MHLLEPVVAAGVLMMGEDFIGCEFMCVWISS